jgi:hypothetical protein
MADRSSAPRVGSGFPTPNDRQIALGGYRPIMLAATVIGATGIARRRRDPRDGCLE